MGDADNLFKWVTNNFPLFSVQCLTPARWTLSTGQGGSWVATEEEGRETFEVTLFLSKLGQYLTLAKMLAFPS